MFIQVHYYCCVDTCRFLLSICNIHLYYICKTQIDGQSQIGIQFSNIWPFFTFSNQRPTTSLTYTSIDVTPVKECFWSNDGEGTRPDSRWGQWFSLRSSLSSLTIDFRKWRVFPVPNLSLEFSRNRIKMFVTIHSSSFAD